MDLASLVIREIENGAIGFHLAIFSVDVPFAMLHHPHIHPYESACGMYIECASEKLSKMVCNLARYPFNSWCTDRLWITIESW